MEDQIIPALRMFERLLIAGFAGMSIYLGYRLFCNLPTETDHEGSIQLPGIKVVLSKVGPGVFFVAFGCAVLLVSLDKKVEITALNEINKNTVFAGNETSKKSFAGSTDVETKSDPGLVQRRLAVIERIGSLNCAFRALQNAQGFDVTQTTKTAFHDAKVALLNPVWSTDDWGDNGVLAVTPDDAIPNQNLKSVFNDLYVGCAS